jgi:DNA methylase
MAVLDQVVDHIGALANSPRRDRGATRAIYSYPAKFQAHLPAELIRLFAPADALVVDPFSGGGTTGLEAFLAGRRFYGVDLNPFSCLLGRVKTTPVDLAHTQAVLDVVLEANERRPILDDDDRQLLGVAISEEIDRLAGGIAAALPDPALDLVTVALLHTIKVAGRRDFAAPSIVPGFRRHAERMAAAAAALPLSGPRPEFRLAPAHDLAGVADAAADLVVTSPPYKDLDVEYGLLQIQRPQVGRSKRSNAMFALLGTPVLPKLVLCGGRGSVYDRRIRPALAEIRRVLRPSAPAFFWIGFKTVDDRERLLTALVEVGLRPRHLVPVGLSRDRVASSRSTHHGRDTGMLARDYLVCCE